MKDSAFFKLKPFDSALASALILVLTCGAAIAGQRKIAKDLERTDPNATINVIVQFRDSATSDHFERARRLAVRAQQKLEHVRAGAFTVRGRDLETLAADPDVEYIAPDRALAAASGVTVAGGASTVLPNVLADTVNARAAWAMGFTGRNIAVAVIDSGINAKVQDLGSASGALDGGGLRIVYRENFLVPPGSSGSYSPSRYQTTDDYGHEERNDHETN